jgi:superfamily II DNA or RNA helicase
MEHKYTLKIGTTHSYLETYDQRFKDKLARAIRARRKGFQHIESYQKGRWDGFIPFFTKRSGMFLTGLRHEVENALKLTNRPYQLIENAETVKWTNNEIGDRFLNHWLPEGLDPIELRDYQPDLANKCFKYNRGIVMAPTGTGKTFILISLLQSLPPKTPVLFMTRNAALVDQNYEEMKKWGVPNVGRFYGTHKDKNYIVCATTNHKTLKNIGAFLPRVKVLLVDEVHECMSETVCKAYDKMESASIRIGFSATPFKYDKRVFEKEHKLLVKGHFGNVFKTSTTKSGFLTTKECQEAGHLSGSNATFYPIDHPDLPYETYQDAIKLGIEENIHFHQIIQRLEKRCKGRKLILVERIQQGKYLKQLMPHAHWLSGKVPLKDRRPVMEMLREDEECTCIAMRHIITAGINVKIHHLINAAGGNAAHSLIQQMGRGLRTAKDKDILQYHDFVYLMNDYLRKHSEWRMEVLENEGHKVTLKEELGF